MQTLDKDKFYFISSDCTTTNIYPKLNRPYDTPFIASFFEDDMQYLKFCLHYDYYINLTPEFDRPPKLAVHAADPQVPLEKVAIMFLDDIEIHWIHHSGVDEVKGFYQNRIERGKGKLPFFIWSDCQLYRPHTVGEREYLISKFLSLPETQRAYFRKEDVSEWTNRSFDDRQFRIGHIYPLSWLDQIFVANMVLDMFGLEKNVRPS